MTVDVGFTTDPGASLEHTRSYLHGDPVRHNVLCTLLRERIDLGDAIRYWWAEEDGVVAGVVFQSPLTAPALLGSLAGDAVEPLARAVADASPRVDGLNGFATDTSRFAGAFATVTRRPGRPVVAQRLYEVTEVTPPQGVDGCVRRALDDDVVLAAEWVAGFDADTGGSVSGYEPEDRARASVASGRLHLWDDRGVPRASALLSTTEAGVTRIGFVYTPPEERCRGYASALVAELSNRILGAGHRCILYTQLSNPVSNAIYQRLGFRPVDEQVAYRFDGPGQAG